MAKIAARTNTEYRAQRCIEQAEALFAKQLRDETFTEAESVQIAECATRTNEAEDAWASVFFFVFIIISISLLIWAVVCVVKSELAWRKWKKEDDARHEALMKKLKEEYEKSSRK